MTQRTINISRICTGNNTIRTAWDPNTRKTLKTISAGRIGLKGARRGSPYAAELVGRELGRILQGLNTDATASNLQGNIYLAGKRLAVGSGIRGLRRSLKDKLRINSITDVTPKPHNGCRARKPRRV